MHLLDRLVACLIVSNDRTAITCREFVLFTVCASRGITSCCLSFPVDPVNDLERLLLNVC